MSDLTDGRDVVIFGTGDFARIATVYLDHDSPHRVRAFTVHESRRTAAELLGRPVVAFERLLETHPPERYAMFVAIGFSKMNASRRAVYEECKRLGYQLISYVSSGASHVGDLALGDNCFVFESNVIQPFVRIGNDVVLWSGNHVGHDSTIGDHCFIASHAVISGNVTIGESCFVGVNATVRDGITVAPRCLIGAGALIMRDTSEGEVYAMKGTPALSMKSWDLKAF
ncbi:MAG: acetyltransferase [Thermoleophilia bacterium]|nr:acetyltransferase [Thermoleophilia bacterium]